MKEIPKFDEELAGALARDLGRPGSSEGPMSYPRAAGFLFALACSPELIRPSEWLPEVLGEDGGEPAEGESSPELLTALISLYNWSEEEIHREGPRLPPGVRPGDNPLADLEPGSPLSEWSVGFVVGHNWCGMGEWMEQAPDDLDEDLGAVFFCLSFFASRKVAEDFVAEETSLGATVESLAAVAVRSFHQAKGEYARFALAVRQVLDDREPEEAPARASNPGRNDPCLCGSGKKYKRCCVK
jgi:uncharacterized protein